MSSTSPYFIISRKIYQKKFSYFVIAASASALLTLFPSIRAVSIALFSYMCLRHTVQLIGGLLWILSQLSPQRQAPILQKNGQLTLSISVPQTLANRSAIYNFIIDYENPMIKNINLVSIRYYCMKALLLSYFLILKTISFSLVSNPQVRWPNTQMVRVEIKYNGKGFGADLQQAFTEAIEDSIIFYSQNYFSQAHYISRSLEKVRAGKWNVFVFRDVNITRVNQVSTGFSYWTDDDTWALWYSVSPLSKNILHLVINTGVSNKRPSNVTTANCQKGSGITDIKADVIASIVSHSDTAKDIATSLQKYDQQKWSVISIPVLLGGTYPEAYSIIHTDEIFVSYHQNVTMLKQKYSQIIYV